MPKFREISGQFVGYIPDSIDSDIVPDRAPMSGRVTFSPVFTGGVIAFPELSPPEFAHPRTIHARIVDGFVQVEVNEGEGDDEQIVLQPLTLMVTVDDEASQVWSWRAEFDEILIGASDEYVKIPAWSFRVPDGTGPVDLTELVPLKSGGSVDVTKGPRGAGLQNITAVDGQLVFAYSDGQESTVPIPEAVQGPQGEPGPAGADGAEGPEGPQGPPGEIPDLLVGNITDATPTGKNLMLAATEGAARNALGLQTGATTIAGAYSELKPGSTQTNSRVWSPKNISDYVEERANEITDAAKNYANVKDYGAIGDGDTNDSQAIADAMAALGNAGGGTLYFPPGGTYYMSVSVRLVSNIEIIGYGATIIKKGDGNVNSAAFIGSGGTTTGYGSGVNNVTVRGLTFRGYFNVADPYNSKGVTSFSLHRAQNVTVEDCNFIEAQGRGHSFDLGGCRFITIRNCTWEGYDRQTFAGTAECIQLDQSKRGSVSTMPGAEIYDGSPTCNVIVEGCRFLPYVKGSTVYPAPNPIGNHTTRQGRPYTDIKFINNLVVDPWEDDTSSGSAQEYRGSIHLIGTNNVEIRGNIFRSTKGVPTRVIALYNVSIGNPVSQDPDVEQPTEAIPPVGCENVKIVDNTFENFLSVAGSGANYTVSCLSISGSAGVTRGLELSRNVFTGRTLTVTEFRAQNVVGFIAKGNTFRPAATGLTPPIVLASGGNGFVVTENILSSGYSGLVADTTGATSVLVEKNLSV